MTLTMELPRRIRPSRSQRATRVRDQARTAAGRGLPIAMGSRSMRSTNSSRSDGQIIAMDRDEGKTSMLAKGRRTENPNQPNSIESQGLTNPLLNARKEMTSASSQARFFLDSQKKNDDD
jgi:hypothetical protein